MDQKRGVLSVSLRQEIDLLLFDDKATVESEENRQSKQVPMNSFEEKCGLYLTLETLPSILWYRLLINIECKTVIA